LKNNIMLCKDFFSKVRWKMKCGETERQRDCRLIDK